MGKLAPILLIAYVAQTWGYYRYLSPSLAHDISVFLGVGLILIAAAFLIHDFCYVATLYRHHIEFRLHPFSHKDEILYSDIESCEVIPTRFPFSHVKLTTDQGKNIWLYNVDGPHKIAEAVKNRRFS